MTNEQPSVSSQTNVKWRREINVRACSQKRFNWGWFNTFSIWRHIIIHYCSVKEWIWTWRNDLIALEFHWHSHWFFSIYLKIARGFKHLLIVPCDVTSRTRTPIFICMRHTRYKTAIQNSGSRMRESSVIVFITRNHKYGRFGYPIRIRPVIVQRQWRFHTKFHSIALIASSVFRNSILYRMNMSTSTTRQMNRSYVASATIRMLLQTPKHDGWKQKSFSIGMKSDIHVRRLNWSFCYYALLFIGNRLKRLQKIFNVWMTAARTDSALLSAFDWKQVFAKWKPLSTQVIYAVSECARIAYNTVHTCPTSNAVFSALNSFTTVQKMHSEDERSTWVDETKEVMMKREESK